MVPFGDLKFQDGTPRDTFNYNGYQDIYENVTLPFGNVLQGHTPVLMDLQTFNSPSFNVVDVYGMLKLVEDTGRVINSVCGKSGMIWLKNLTNSLSFPLNHKAGILERSQGKCASLLH